MNLSNPRLYLDGKEVGEIKDIDFSTNTGTIYADAEIQNIPVWKPAEFTGTIIRTTKHFKLFVKSMQETELQTKGAIKALNEFFKKITGTQGKEKYLKRMKNRIKKEKRRR